MRKILFFAIFLYGGFSDKDYCRFFFNEFWPDPANNDIDITVETDDKDIKIIMDAHRRMYATSLISARGDYCLSIIARVPEVLSQLKQVTDKDYLKNEGSVIWWEEQGIKFDNSGENMILDDQYIIGVIEYVVCRYDVTITIQGLQELLKAYGETSLHDEIKKIFKNKITQEVKEKINVIDGTGDFASKMEAIASIPSLLLKFKWVTENVVYAEIEDEWKQTCSKVGISFDENKLIFDYHVIIGKINEIIKTYKDTITMENLEEWKDKLSKAYEPIIPKCSEIIRCIFDIEIESKEQYRKIIAAISKKAKEIKCCINCDGDCSSKMEAIASIPSLLLQFKGIDKSILCAEISQNREDFCELGISFDGKNELIFDYHVIIGKINEIIKTYKDTITMENSKEWKDKLSKAYDGYGVPVDYVFNKEIKQELLQKIKHMFDLKTPIDRIKYLKDFVYSVGLALNNAFLFDQQELVNFEFLKYEKGVYKINCDSRLLLCEDYYIVKERIEEILSRNFYFGQLYENIKEFISDEYISNLKSVVEELKKSQKTLGSYILVATLDTITGDLYKFYKKLLILQSYIINKIHFNREFFSMNNICIRLKSCRDSCHSVIRDVCKTLKFLQDPIVLKNKMFCTFNGCDDDDIIIPVLMSQLGEPVFLEVLKKTVRQIKDNFQNVGILYVNDRYQMKACYISQLLNKAADNDEEIKHLTSATDAKKYLQELIDFDKLLYRGGVFFTTASEYEDLHNCVSSIIGKVNGRIRQLVGKEKRTPIYRDVELRNARKKAEKRYFKVISKESIMNTEKLVIPQMFADEGIFEEKHFKSEEEQLKKIEEERGKIQKELDRKIKESGDVVIAEEGIKQLDVIKNKKVRQQNIVQQHAERKVLNRRNNVITSNKKISNRKFVTKTIGIKTNNNSNVRNKSNVKKNSKNNLRYIGMRSTNVDGKIILPEEYVKLPLFMQKEYTVYEGE